MKISTEWKGQLRFELGAGDNRSAMDASPPIGAGSAPTPKQLLLGAICGCTGIDVAARMRKLRRTISSLRIDAEADKKDGPPATFSEVRLDFFLDGDMTAEEALEAVKISQTRDCGVSAMVASHCPIRYRVHLKGQLVGEGLSAFPA